MKGRFRCISQINAPWGERGSTRESNTLVLNPRCGSVSYGCCDTVWNSAFVGPL